MTHIKRVLVVEDEALIAMSIEQSLTDLGYEVVGPYHNLQDGLDHSSRQETDFALLDFDLGNGTNSLPIVERLSASGTPYAFVTGSSPDYIRRFLPRARILGKPMNDDVLRKALAAA